MNDPSDTSHDHLIVKTRDLGRVFGATEALKRLNLEVRRGEIFGLVGPDGAGKTTTMRILAGILPPTSGNAWVNGISVLDDPEAIKERIAYMPQRFGLYEDLSVIENLIFYADLFRVPKKLRPEKIEMLFGFSRLGPFKDRAAGALSGGMKQKLGLACALIHSPKLLLLDEPTNGVDPVSRRDFWRILYGLLTQGISMLVSTAYLDEADRTSRVGLMNNGALVHFGEPRQIKELVKGFFFELVSPETGKAKDILTGRPVVLDVNLFGEGLHIRVENESDADDVRCLIDEAGIPIASFRRINPAMEDAFLSLIRDAPRSGPSGDGGR
jgi:ABC-2 type transport system ATP-binding protein